MKLTDLHKIELEAMAAKGELTCHEIEASRLYKDMQTATSLDAKAVEITSNAMILLARIASLSPSLVEGNFSSNELRGDALAVVVHLVQSKTLHTINLMDNHLSSNVKAEVSEIIFEHNKEVRESLELEEALKYLSGVYSSVDYQYGSVGKAISLVATETAETFPDNVIELLIDTPGNAWHSIIADSNSVINEAEEIEESVNIYGDFNFDDLNMEDLWHNQVEMAGQNSIQM